MENKKFVILNETKGNEESYLSYLFPPKILRYAQNDKYDVKWIFHIRSKGQ